MADAPPDAPHPRHLPDPSIEVIRNAIMVPPGETGRLPIGVFRPDGSFVQHSRMQLLRHRMTDVPPPPDPATVTPLKGRYLYGGLGRSHFGHFVIEALSRLWALGRATTGPLDGVLYSPMPGRNLKRLLNHRYRDLYTTLAGDIPAIPVETPVRVDELLVPSQGMGHFAWIEGTPEHRAFLRDRFAARHAPDGPPDLYISRSQLRRSSFPFENELEVEAMMAAAGYTIFHPQQHSMAEQAACYMAARRLVGGDGSAFHFAAMMISPQTRVGVIHRRHYDAIIEAMKTHVVAFSGAKLTAFNTLLPPDPENPLGSAPIDIARLRDQMQQAGFL